MKSVPIGFAFSLLCAAATAAPPASDHGVVADLAVAKVTQKAGNQTTFESAKNTAPGDVVEYRITYRNTNYAPAYGVVGTLTIPVQKYTYVGDSATRGVMLEASLDGKTFEPVPLKRLAVGENGQMKMQPVPASEYRYLRWQLGDLPARGTVTMSARMRVVEPPMVLVTNNAR